MTYVVFVGTEGVGSQEKMEFFEREWPAWEAERERRGVHLVGRELELPANGALTVRVRDGETLLTDGPFAETKEYLGGFDLLECTDLAEAVEADSNSPVLRYHPNEIRELSFGLTRGAGFDAFAARDDQAGIPYLLTVWTDEPAPGAMDATVAAAWRSEQDAANVFILGAELAAADTALTLRFKGGAITQTPGPFLTTPAQMTAIEVVLGTDLNDAGAVAACHPLATTHTIEVRPFYSDRRTAPRR